MQAIPVWNLTSTVPLLFVPFILIQSRYSFTVAATVRDQTWPCRLAGKARSRCAKKKRLGQRGPLGENACIRFSLLLQRDHGCCLKFLSGSTQVHPLRTPLCCFGCAKTRTISQKLSSASMMCSGLRDGTRPAGGLRVALWAEGAS